MKPLKLIAITATVVAAIFTVGPDAALAAGTTSATVTAKASPTAHQAPAHVTIVQATYQASATPSMPRKPGSDWPWPG